MLIKKISTLLSRGDLKFYKFTYNCSLFNNLNYSVSNKKYVFLFGGQGNQQKGMFSKIAENPDAMKIIQAQTKKLGIDFMEITTTDSNNVINLTQYTQPLLLLSQYLQFHYGQHKITNSSNQHNFQNTYCVGHSLGQYSALVASKSISLSQCLRLVSKRGQLMTKASQQQKFGTLLIKFHPSKSQPLLKLVNKMQLQIGCYNTPSIFLVSGTMNKLTDLKDKIKQQLKIASRILPVSTAFHCKVLQKMQKQYKEVLQSIDFKQPKYRILRNIDGKVYKNKNDIVQGLLVQNVKPVLFYQSIQQVIKKQGAQNLQFIEFGHKQYLKKWVQEIKGSV